VGAVPSPQSQVNGVVGHCESPPLTTIWPETGLTDWTLIASVDGDSNSTRLKSKSAAGAAVAHATTIANRPALRTIEETGGGIIRGVFLDEASPAG